MTQYSGWGEREMGLFGSFLHSWRSWALTHMLALTSPVGEIMGQKGLSLPWAILPWGRGDVGVKSVSFTLSSASKLIFFAPTVCWNFSAKNLHFHKGSLICVWLSKTVTSVGSQTVRGDVARTRVYMPITWCRGRQDSSWIDHGEYILDLIFPTTCSVQSLEAPGSWGVETWFDSQEFSSIICLSIKRIIQLSPDDLRASLPLRVHFPFLQHFSLITCIVSCVESHKMPICPRAYSVGLLWMAWILTLLWTYWLISSCFSWTTCTIKSQAYFSYRYSEPK